VDLSKIERGVELILKGLDCDIKDRNYRETPERVARFYAEMFSSQQTEWATFPEDFTDFILLRRHRMYSLCPHHLLPVRLDVSLAYIPNGEVLGLSKLARVLHECNSRPLLQERFTRDAIGEVQRICHGTKGVAILVEGQHGCTLIRGVHSEAEFITYRLEGVFKDDPDMEYRFFDLARSR
jgi:GTP cyclohydrolase I